MDHITIPRTIMTRTSHILFAVLVSTSTPMLAACSQLAPLSGPTTNTFVDVPDSDFALWDGNGKKLDHWNSLSYQRAAATKLTYKSFVFHPAMERQQMEKNIDQQNIGGLLKQIEDSHYKLTLLHDGRILGRGEMKEGGLHEPTSKLVLLDRKKHNVIELSELKVPRMDDAVVQLKDGRVICIGGETSSQFADDGTDNLTNTVEALDIDSGKSELIGRILCPRHAVMAELAISIF